jgi:hypothetical protein
MSQDQPTYDPPCCPICGSAEEVYWECSKSDGDEGGVMNEEFKQWLEVEKAEAWKEYQVLYEKHGWHIMNCVRTVSPEDLNEFYTAAANFRTLERALDEYKTYMDK